MPVTASEPLRIECDNCGKGSGWNGSKPLPTGWALVYRGATHYCFCSWQCEAEYSTHEARGKQAQEIPWVENDVADLFTTLGQGRLSLLVRGDAATTDTLQIDVEKENQN